ncbi:MAG: hypothetical protein ACLTEX_04840 [Eggerthella lenta]
MGRCLCRRLRPVLAGYVLNSSLSAYTYDALEALAASCPRGRNRAVACIRATRRLLKGALEGR